MKPDVKHCLERAYEEAVRAIRSPDPLLAAAHDALSVEFSLKAAKLLRQQDDGGRSS